MHIKNKRKGFSLLETVIAFGLFFIMLCAILSTTYTSLAFSNQTVTYAIRMAETRMGIDYIQRQFESAQRMQTEQISNPSNVTSVSFKRSTSGGYYWTSIAVQNNNSIKIGNATSVISSYGGSKVFMDFYSPANIHIASNSMDLYSIPNLNTKATEFWRLRMSFMLNAGKPISFSTAREVSPYLEKPTITSIASNTYTFNIPIDTEKNASSFTISSRTDNTITSSTGYSTIVSNANQVSSYLGIPAVIPTTFYGLTYYPSGLTIKWSGYLYTGVGTTTVTPLANAVIYAYNNAGYFYITYTDASGQFRIPLMDTYGHTTPNSPITFSFNGTFYNGTTFSVNENYAECFASQ